MVFLRVSGIPGVCAVRFCYCLIVRAAGFRSCLFTRAVPGVCAALRRMAYAVP